jgi:hypothetical protein
LDNGPCYIQRPSSKVSGETKKEAQSSLRSTPIKEPRAQIYPFRLICGIPELSTIKKRTPNQCVILISDRSVFVIICVSTTVQHGRCRLPVLHGKVVYCSLQHNNANLLPVQNTTKYGEKNPSTCMFLMKPKLDDTQSKAQSVPLPSTICLQSLRIPLCGHVCRGGVPSPGPLI